jgi:hypothetical protein
MFAAFDADRPIGDADQPFDAALLASRIRFRSAASDVIATGRPFVALRQIIVGLRQPEAWADTGLAPVRAVLLSGPAGSGKTVALGWLADQIGRGKRIHTLTRSDLNAVRVGGAFDLLSPADILHIERIEDIAAHDILGHPAVGALVERLSDGRPGPLVVLETESAAGDLTGELSSSAILPYIIALSAPGPIERRAFLEARLAGLVDGNVDWSHLANLPPIESMLRRTSWREISHSVRLLHSSIGPVTEGAIAMRLMFGTSVIGDGDGDGHRWEAAIHEAGHIAAVVLTRGVAGLTAAQIPDCDIRTGRVFFGSENDASDRHFVPIPSDLIVLAAGHHADRLLVSGDGGGGSTDLMVARTRIVEAIVAQWRRSSVYRTDQSVLDELLPAYLGEALATVMAVVHRLTAAMVVRNATAIERMAATLMEHSHLSGAQLRAAAQAAGFVGADETLAKDGDARRLEPDLWTISDAIEAMGMRLGDPETRLSDDQQQPKKSLIEMINAIYPDSRDLNAA